MRRGFSLIEIVITLSILGIIAAMAMPRYTDASDGYKLDSAERQIRSTLQSWSKRVDASSELHTVYFDIAAEKLYLYKGTAQLAKTPVDTLDLGSTPFKVNLFSTSLVDPNNQLVINGHGLFERDATVLIYIGKRQGLEFTIRGGGNTRYPIAADVPTRFIGQPAFAEPVSVGFSEISP